METLIARKLVQNTRRPLRTRPWRWSWFVNLISMNVLYSLNAEERRSWKAVKRKTEEEVSNNEDNKQTKALWNADRWYRGDTKKNKREVVLVKSPHAPLRGPILGSPKTFFTLTKKISCDWQLWKLILLSKLQSFKTMRIIWLLNYYYNA